MKILNRNLLVVIALASSVLSCSPTKTTEEYLLSAEKYVAEKKYNEAIISFKNAIKNDPENAEARYQLGSSYLTLGSYRSAEKEFLTAQELDFNEELLAIKLAPVYFSLNKDEELIELVDNTRFEEATNETVALLYLAKSYIRNKKNDLASMTIEKANTLASNSIYSQVGGGYLLAESNNVADAEKIADQLLQDNPEMYQALLLKGQLAHIKKDFAVAISSYKKLMSLKPNDNNLTMLLANVYVHAKKYSDALPLLNNLISYAPGNGLINQLMGIVKYNEKDFENAKLFFERAIQNGSDTPRVRLLAGVSNFYLDNMEQTYRHLSPLAENLPNNHIGLRLLAAAQLQLGYDIEASESIANFELMENESDELYLNAGLSFLNKGNKNLATKMLQLTKENNELSSDALMKKGALKLALNDASGIDELEESLYKDSDQEMAKALLAGTYIKSGNYTKTLEIAEEWIKKYPNETKGFNLAGMAYLKLNKPNEAEKYLAKASELSPNNALTLYFYADKAVESNKFDEALSFSEKLMKHHADYIPGLIQYYKIHDEHGDISQVLNVFRATSEANPTKLKVQLLYASVLAKNNKFDEVIVVLNKFDNSSLKSPLYWRYLGDALVRVQKYEKAMDVYNQWLVESTNSEDVKLRIAYLHTTLKEYEQALKVVNSLTLDDTQKVKLTTFRAYLLNKADKNNEAIAAINAIEHSKSKFLLNIKGESFVKMEAYELAYQAYLTLYQLNPTSKNAQLVVLQLDRLLKINEAKSFLIKHLNINDKDSNNRFRLANYYIGSENEVALEHYLQLVLELPDNPNILNNAAWLLLQNDELDKALPYAKKAYNLEPENSSFTDTYASILDKLGNTAEANKLRSN